MLNGRDCEALEELSLRLERQERLEWQWLRLKWLLILLALQLEALESLAVLLLEALGLLLVSSVGPRRLAQLLESLSEPTGRGWVGERLRVRVVGGLVAGQFGVAVRSRRRPVLRGRDWRRSVSGARSRSGRRSVCSVDISLTRTRQVERRFRLEACGRVRSHLLTLESRRLAESLRTVAGIERRLSRHTQNAQRSDQCNFSNHFLDFFALNTQTRTDTISLSDITFIPNRNRSEETATTNRKQHLQLISDSSSVDIDIGYVRTYRSAIAIGSNEFGDRRIDHNGQLE